MTVKHPTVDEIAADIIAQMSEADKATVVNTSEDDLIVFHHGWGTSIRNSYNLHHNHAFVKSFGVEHADDAAMLIIQAVHKALKSEEKCKDPSSKRGASG